jgi:phosphatidylglycerol:prolipoprotein diacylglycerol transferase
VNLPPLYALTTLAAMVLCGVFWWRLARKDSHLFLLYLGALFGALIGAKIGWFVAEGWREVGEPYFWLMFATGKTILGGLLGGFLTVELLKRVLGVRRPTGDWFATVVPLGIAIGRIGCIREGCCLGVPWDGWCAVKDAHGMPRWPSAQLELAFNLLAAAVFFVLRRRGVLPGQHFHLYLIAYGLFRFLHEFARETPREVGPFSGYQVLALACVVAGVTGFVRRSRG